MTDPRHLDGEQTEQLTTALTVCPELRATAELMLASTALFIAPLLLAMIGRDLAWSTESHPWGMERLIHLFVYNYQRPWPPNFDYRPILTGFAIVSSVTIAAAPTGR